MSKRVERNLEAIRTLSTASHTLRSSLIKSGSKDLVLALVECAENIVKGRVKLNKKQYKQLKRYAKQLKTFLKRNVSEKTRRGILVQKGGFLGALLRPILGLLMK